MSRRRHQGGQLVETSRGYAARFYEDFWHDGNRQRRRVQKFLGTFKQLTKRQALTRMDELLRPVNDPQSPIRTTATFREVAEVWIADCETRKRKPVKPSVLYNWRRILDNHVLDVLGNTPISNVGNRAMKNLVEVLNRKGLSPATLKNITLVVKLVKSSLVDEDGNQVYATKWNNEFIDLPIVDSRKQRRPTFTAEEVSRIVQVSRGRLRMAVLLLASTGIRAGELLGLECKHFDGSALSIEQAMWSGSIVDPKTPYSRRLVDLHPDVARLLATFVDRRRGLIFQTRNGWPLNQRNLARSLYSVLDRLGMERRGFHAFRRYRNTLLRNARCPDGLLKFWMGHANRDMSDLYDTVREDLQFRRDVAASVGVGFEVPKTLASATQLGTIGRRAETATAEIAVSC